MNDNTGLPFISDFEIDESLSWQMSRAEKYCLINLLKTIQPDFAIEIGTFQGGSLQVISKYAKNVCSIDISTEPKRTLAPKFKNVDFRVGNSTEVLPQVFEEIQQSGRKLNFVLVDGDHSKNGVYNDLKTILDFDHQHPLYIICHDSFNPDCRSGLKKINFKKYRSVEYVELDYICGSFWANDTYREMWGGFALIKLGNGNENLIINESYKKAFETARYHSVHPIKDRLRFLSPLKRRLQKTLNLKNNTDKYFNFDDK